ncbi:hypothetical protein [Methylobacterium radiotolerans]
MACNPEAEDDRLARQIVEEWRAWVKSPEYGPTEPLAELSLRELARIIAERLEQRRHPAAKAAG